MSETGCSRSQYEADLALTVHNRAKLYRNTNLLYWYEKLYRDQFRNLASPETLRILEIGSGVSPLQQFYPNVLTSDVLELEYLDLVFDCHAIDEVPELHDKTFDAITLTNVLHHLRNPLEFLRRAAVKLKRGGKLIATEPYFSILSTPIFKYLHHESVDFSIAKPELAKGGGPLANANIAIPWLMFVKNPSWVQQLRDIYDFTDNSLRTFTSLSYMGTGGISHRIPLPSWIYRLLFQIDLSLSRALPRVCASFFTVTLIRK